MPVMVAIIALLVGIGIGLGIGCVRMAKTSHADVHEALFRKCVSSILQRLPKRDSEVASGDTKLRNALRVLAFEADCAIKSGIGGLSVSEVQKAAGSRFAFLISQPGAPPRALGAFLGSAAPGAT
jgi:hypothetical protein